MRKAVLVLWSCGLLMGHPAVYTNNQGMEFILIGPGTMQVGVFDPTCPSPPQPNDEKADPRTRWIAADYQHCSELAARDSSPGFTVSIVKPYYMGRYEVTQGEWKRVLGGGNPSVFQGSKVADNADRHPVENVTWADTQRFISRLNELDPANTYRLPTEFEWEYAGRAGGPGQTGWTDIRAQAVQGISTGSPTTQPVGSKKPNAWGLYDMLGNVWEWVQDGYNGKMFPDPASPATAAEHVLKGGGFASDVKNAIYATHAAGPGDGWDVGFRIVMQLKADAAKRANEAGVEEADPAAAAAGREVFQPTCGFCHGADGRGGAAGGPDLARSGVVLDDIGGKQLGEFLKVGRPSKGMPAFNLQEQQVSAIAAFLHSIVTGASAQMDNKEAILVGNAGAGKAFFNGEGGCASCHSVTGDLRNIGSRYDPVTLQGRLVLPVGDGGYPGGEPVSTGKPRQTVTVTQPAGEIIEGELIFISDFAVTLRDRAGVRRTLARSANSPKVEVHDSLQAHLDLQRRITDKQMHDLTAYLVTLK